jgi:hypothetical protein
MRRKLVLVLALAPLLLNVAQLSAHHSFAAEFDPPGTEILIEGYQAKDGSNKANGRMSPSPTVESSFSAPLAPAPRTTTRDNGVRRTRSTALRSRRLTTA